MFSKLKEKLRGTNSETAMSELDRENALEQLMKFDTQFLIDDSGSMAGSRWNEARDALIGLAELALKHDEDGIEIFFLNDVDSGRTVKNKEDVRQLFYSVKPGGGTPTGTRLEQILTQYITRLEAAKTKSGGADPLQSGIKPLNLIVITDGEPTDDPESVIIAAARRLDAGQFSLTQAGIQFIQVGDDKKASKALHELDTHLGENNNIRDIVDTRPYKGKKLTPELLIAMLLGGINRRIDRIKKPGESKEYDIVFIIDDSGSMAGPRWKEAGKALSRVAEIASQYDPDGIDIYFLNSREFGPGLTTPGEVEKLFQHVQPYGPTPTGDRLDWHLNEYMNRYKKAKDESGVLPKPVNFIVITDGVPTDDPRSVIVQAARRMDAENLLLRQVGIQFIQVGDDSKASKALKELDDGLSKKERIRDFVDTTPYKGKPLTAEMIIKILLGGINRRVDNKGGKSVIH